MDIKSEVRLGHRTYDNIVESVLNEPELDELPELRKAFELVRDNPLEQQEPEDVGDAPKGLLPFDKNTAAEDIIRLFIKGARKLDPESFNRAYDLLEKELQKKLDDFLDGTSFTKLLGEDEGFNVPASQAAKEKFEKLEKAVSGPALDGSKSVTDIGSLKPAFNDEFSNWGETVKNTPSVTWAAPTSIEQLQEIVLSANRDGLRVRCAGYRHSWSQIFSGDKQVLVSMLDQKLVETLPNCTSLVKDQNYGDNYFKKIEFLGPDEKNPKKGLVRVGAAVTNEDFRRWCMKDGRWTLPLNVIMVEITFGGSNAPICHGAGINTKTLSDLVREIEYVDCKGYIQRINDQNQLRAAAGCFGLLGIVTSMILEVDQMSYAILDPRYEDLLLAIPPPDDDPTFEVPEELREEYEDLKRNKPRVLQKAREDFIKTATECYYAEWFWFPPQKQAFINSWKTTNEKEGAVEYPSKWRVLAEWFSSWGGEVVQNSLFSERFWTPKIFTPSVQALIMSYFAMWTLPKERGLKTQLINALHFRRGIQNMRVGDFEVEIPIPPVQGKTGSKLPEDRDWKVVQKAWWDGICAMYRDKNFSARIALEMRVTGSSDIILAPQRHNDLGTASIEIITNMPAVKNKKGIWKNFKQELADKWTTYTGPDGKPLNTRPHFAKEWSDTKVFGKPWVKHLRETSMTSDIEEFKEVLGEIGKIQGWTLDDLKSTFSTRLLDELIFGD